MAMATNKSRQVTSHPLVRNASRREERSPGRSGQKPSRKKSTNYFTRCTIYDEFISIMRQITEKSHSFISFYFVIWWWGNRADKKKTCVSKWRVKFSLSPGQYWNILALHNHVFEGKCLDSDLDHFCSSKVTKSHPRLATKKKMRCNLTWDHFCKCWAAHPRFGDKNINKNLGDLTSGSFLQHSPCLRIFYLFFFSSWDHFCSASAFFFWEKNAWIFFLERWKKDGIYTYIYIYYT